MCTLLLNFFFNQLNLLVEISLYLPHIVPSDSVFLQCLDSLQYLCHSYIILVFDFSFELGKSAFKILNHFAHWCHLRFDCFISKVISFLSKCFQLAWQCIHSRLKSSFFLHILCEQRLLFSRILTLDSTFEVLYLITYSLITNHFFLFKFVEWATVRSFENILIH